MVSLKKILVGILIAVYPLSLQSDLVFAKSKQSQKKKKNKKRKNIVKSASSQVSNSDDNYGDGESVSEVSSVSTVATVQPVASVVTSTPVTTQESVASVNTTTTSEEIDVSKDEKWDNFRICMQSNCGASDDLPNNVNCYKSLNFDNAFENCKMMIEESKHESFKNYFTGPFLNAEKKAFCEGDVYKGKFNEATGKCAVTVTYTRSAYDGKQFDCKAEKKNLTWYLDNKNYVCSGDAFNVSECYQDSANYESAKMQQIMGGISLGMGALTAGLSVFSGGQVDSGKRDKDGNAIMRDRSKGEKAYDAIAGSSGQLTEGITQMATADIMMKQKGDRIFGKCIISDGHIVSEGSAVKLSWDTQW